MTAQITDRVRYQGVEHTLLGPRTGLFLPQAHGLQVTAVHTACWRGFHCLYTLSDRLRLAHVHLQMAYPDPDENLLGKRAARYEAGRAEFRDLDHPIELTGRLWLANDVLDEYVRFASAPFHFRTVHEVVLDRGVPIAHHDRSDAMTAMRARIAAKKISQTQLSQWLAARLG